MDICRLNAQTLRDSADKGETARGPPNPTPGGARHLPVLKINSRATAERSEVAGICFLALDYHPGSPGYFLTIIRFRGTWSETTYGTRGRGQRRRPRRHAEGGRDAPSVCNSRCLFLNLFLFQWWCFNVYRKGKSWFRNHPRVHPDFTTVTPPRGHAGAAPAQGVAGTSQPQRGDGSPGPSRHTVSSAVTLSDVPGRSAPRRPRLAPSRSELGPQRWVWGLHLALLPLPST